MGTARLYCKEAEKCYKAKAYFAAIALRGCELEALLRIFDFVENRRPKDRCKKFYSLINRAFARHWIPHDALRFWSKTERFPLKVCLELREARNGVHAHIFERGLMTRRVVSNVTYVVHSMYSFLEIKNARNLMLALRQRGEISAERVQGLEKETGQNQISVVREAHCEAFTSF